MRQQDAIPDLDDMSGEEVVDEDDLWFLPGPDVEEDVPPGFQPERSSAVAALFDPAPWREAQGEHASDLAEVAGLLGALDQRLRLGPAGWRMRLVLREVSDLSWWVGDRLGQERIALWIALRIGSIDDTEQALARAGWAALHLSKGSFPAEDLEGFLERVPRGAESFSKSAAPENAIADLDEVLAAGKGLHPIVAAARLFQAWRALGPAATADIEAAVLAARHAASANRRSEQGALFLPLVQSGLDAVRAQGDPTTRLSAWLRGAERATLSALLHLDQVAAWRERARQAVTDLSGRTPPRVLDLLESWPQTTAPMAEAETGASRAAVQRTLDLLECRGIIREITGQGRYRVWTAMLN